MAVQENGNLRPDGFSLSWAPSIPGLRAGVSGTYYWNPGSPTAPPITISGILGLGPSVWSAGPGLGGGLVFRRNGMTSADSLGYGTSLNASTMVPSVTLNSSVPDKNNIPQPDQAKVSSVEAGIDTSVGASAAGTYTATPQQITDFLSGLLITPAMGPSDELSPFARTLRSGIGTVGARSEPPIRYLSWRNQSSFGNGMGDWRSSSDPVDSRNPSPPASSSLVPGGLLGLMMDYMSRN